LKETRQLPKGYNDAANASEYTLPPRRAVLAALFAHPQQQRSAKQAKYKSPDGSLVAIVKSVSQPEATDESEVRVQTASGKVLVRHNYRSGDGEHGYGVTKA
jgi:hypothetical protein